MIPSPPVSPEHAGNGEDPLSPPCLPNRRSKPASTRLKAAADRIAPTHDEDGLVDVVPWLLE